ncbi:MAG: DUF1269 domain-containing protein [Chloroflexi bacterium]|nr:DUF1269 domain-containing protein [Chloroflexota bacterium]
MVGAVAGGAVGKLMKAGVSKDFIEDVGNELKPGSSAVFFVIRSADAAPHIGNFASIPRQSATNHVALRIGKNP